MELKEGYTSDDLDKLVVERDRNEHRTGRKLPDGSWEPTPYSSWIDANPADEEDDFLRRPDGSIYGRR